MLDSDTITIPTERLHCHGMWVNAHKSAFIHILPCNYLQCLHIYQEIHKVLPWHTVSHCWHTTLFPPTPCQQGWLYHNSLVYIYCTWISYFSVHSPLSTHYYVVVISAHLALMGLSALFDLWMHLHQLYWCTLLDLDFSLCPQGKVAKDTYYNWWYALYCINISYTCSRSVSGTHISSSGPYPFHLSKYYYSVEVIFTFQHLKTAVVVGLFNGPLSVFYVTVPSPHVLT